MTQDQTSKDPSDKTPVPVDQPHDKSAKDTTQSSKTTSAKKSTSKPKKTSYLFAGFFKLVIWLVVLSGLGYGGWLGWQEWQTYQSAKTAEIQILSDVQDQLTQLERDNQQLRSQLGQVRSSTSEQVQTLRQELINTARRFTESQGVTRYEWLLAEAEYLMRLAQQRLRIEKDAQGALTILQSADAVLRDAGDAALLDVRAALAQEMSALAKVKQIDITGLYLKLLAASKDVSDWRFSPDFQTATASANTEDQAWYQRFSQFIRVQSLDEDFVRPLAPDQQAVLKDILTLKLEQAQLALLQRNQQAYEASLEQVLNLLNQFAAYQDEANFVSEQITGLQSQSLNPELPKIGESLTLLKGYIAEVYALQKVAPESESESGEAQ